MGKKNKIMDFPTPENFDQFFEGFINELCEPKMGGMMAVYEIGPRENYSTLFETSVGGMETELKVWFEISGSKASALFTPKVKGAVKMMPGMSKNVGKLLKPQIKAAVHKILKQK